MSNEAVDKSFSFSVRIVNLYKYLKDSKREFTLSKQILRSGTSIGANIAEAQQAQSRADFISKLSIALKETAETIYWLRLLEATDYISNKMFCSIYADCQQIKGILTAIIRTSKEVE